jgi:hypothetical protein
MHTHMHVNVMGEICEYTCAFQCDMGDSNVGTCLKSKLVMRVKKRVVCSMTDMDSMSVQKNVLIKQLHQNTSHFPKDRN